MNLVQILATPRPTTTPALNPAVDTVSATCDANLLIIVKFIRQGVFPIIQIGIPIILILMGSIDLGKAVLSSDDKEIKGAVGKLVKRAIAAVAVFFVATIVTLVMDFFSSTGNDEDLGTSKWKACWDAAKNS